MVAAQLAVDSHSVAYKEKARRVKSGVPKAPEGDGVVFADESPRSIVDDGRVVRVEGDQGWSRSKFWHSPLVGNPKTLKDRCGRQLMSPFVGRSWPCSGVSGVVVVR